MPSIGAEHIAAVTGCFLSGQEMNSPNSLSQCKANVGHQGAIMSVFLITIPVLIDTTKEPARLVNHWRRVYLSGHVKGPAIAATTGLIHGYAAWNKHAAGEPWRVFALAGLTTVCIVPFTLTFMQSTNNALFRADDLAIKGTEPALAEAQRLVIRWGRLNAIRALIPLAGGVLGMLGACGILVF